MRRQLITGICIIANVTTKFVLLLLWCNYRLSIMLCFLFFCLFFMWVAALKITSSFIVCFEFSKPLWFIDTFSLIISKLFINVSHLLMVFKNYYKMLWLFLESIQLFSCGLNNIIQSICQLHNVMNRLFCPQTCEAIHNFYYLLYSCLINYDL